MNNGNLLNSLLGITSANSAATKASSAKARAETNEKFQQALEQARPEVAARKPVARKESTANEAPAAARSNSKPTIRHNSQSEIHRADSRSKAQLDESKVVSKTKEVPESSVANADASKPVDENQKNIQSLEARDQTPAEQAETLASTGDILLTDPALATTGQSGEMFMSPENLLSPNTDSLGQGELANAVDIAALLNSDGNPVLPDTSLSPLTALASEEPADTSAGNLSPLMAASQATLSQAVSGGAGSQLIAGQTSFTPSALAGDLSDKLTLDTEIEGAAVEGESSGNTDSGDNPDFFLLNSKAALNKLAEANMTAPAQDKAALADAAKPAALTAAVESLTRLTEAQSPAARAFVVQTGVPVTVGTPQWSQAVGDKVLWLAAQNVSAAEIRLDPPELGPMQVRVSINQDQASVTFTSPHPVVREALDQQLNRLREMFSEQGLNLVNVDVSDKSFAQQEREQKESAKNQTGTELDDDDLVPVGLSQTISTRLVDHYA